MAAPARRPSFARRAAPGCAALAVVLLLIGWGLYAIGLVRILPGGGGSAGGQAIVPETAAAVALPEARGLLVPVAGVPRAALTPGWGDPRDGGARAHHGTDILAPRGTPVVAAAPGTVEKLWLSGPGGITLYVRSPRRRVIYYYAHLAAYAPGLREGQAVRAGQLLGYVGDTGNAGAGNYHLHFGVAVVEPGQPWHGGTDVDPYPLLAGKPAPR